MLNTTALFLVRITYLCRFSEILSGQKFVFLEAPVNSGTIIYCGLLPTSSVRLTLVRERRKKLGTIRNRPIRGTVDQTYVRCDCTVRCNFGFVVMSKEYNQEMIFLRYCLIFKWRLVPYWDSIRQSWWVTCYFLWGIDVLHMDNWITEDTFTLF